jgi:hypothetical protein
MINSTFLAKPNKTSSLTVDANLDMGAFSLISNSLYGTAAESSLIVNNDGTDIIMRIDTDVRSNDSATPVEAAYMIIPQTGTAGKVKVQFVLYGTATDEEATGRIYVGGVATGTNRTGTGVFSVTYTEEVTAAAGARVSIYLAEVNAPGHGYAYCKNFRILGTRNAMVSQHYYTGVAVKTF